MVFSHFLSFRGCVPALVSGANFCPPAEIIDDIYTKSPTNADKDARFICEDNVPSLGYEVQGLAGGNGFYLEWEVTRIEGKKEGKYPTYNGTVPATDGSVNGVNPTVYSNGHHTFDVNAGMMGLEDKAPESRFIMLSYIPYMINTNNVSCPGNPDTWRVTIFPRPEMALDNAAAPGVPIIINSGDDPTGLISIDHTGKIKEGGTGVLLYDVHIDPNPDITELAAGLDLTAVGSAAPNKGDKEFDGPIDLGISSFTNTSGGAVTVSVEVRPIFDPSMTRSADIDPVTNPEGYCDAPVQTMDIVVNSQGPRSANTVFEIAGQNVSFSLYPNPAERQFFLQATQVLEDAQRFEITNMLGQQLLHGEIEAGTARAKVNVDHLAAGVYMVRVLNPKGKDALLRFEKTN